MSAPAVRLRGVGRRFVDRTLRPRSLKETLIAACRGRRPPRPEIVALDGIDLAVERGESVGLAGPNGAGKTTLLEIVAGLLPPTAGQVEVRGRVATLFELGAGFLPELTGRENVRLGGALHGLSDDEIETRAPGILEFAGLGRRIDSPLWTYSAGMQLRLAFAITTAVDGEVLLIDETIAVGDDDFQQRCAAWLARRRREGVSVLLASHVPALLERWCDRVVRLERGSIVENRG